MDLSDEVRSSWAYLFWAAEHCESAIFARLAEKWGIPVAIGPDGTLRLQ